MKKFALALVALLALSFTFMSCDTPADQVLTAEDVTADWYNGTWSGTTTITATIDGNTTTTKQDFEAVPADVKGLKATIALDGTEVMILGSGVKTASVVKANKKRTKLYTEVVVSTYIDNKVTATSTTVSEMEKD